MLPYSITRPQYVKHVICDMKAIYSCQQYRCIFHNMFSLRHRMKSWRFRRAVDEIERSLKWTELSLLNLLSEPLRRLGVYRVLLSAVVHAAVPYSDEYYEATEAICAIRSVRLTILWLIPRAVIGFMKFLLTNVSQFHLPQMLFIKQDLRCLYMISRGIIYVSFCSHCVLSSCKISLFIIYIIMDTP